jgi:hypothetical protein
MGPAHLWWTILYVGVESRHAEHPVHLRQRLAAEPGDPLERRLRLRVGAARL